MQFVIKVIRCCFVISASPLKFGLWSFSSARGSYSDRPRFWHYCSFICLCPIISIYYILNVGFTYLELVKEVGEYTECLPAPLLLPVLLIWKMKLYLLWNEHSTLSGCVLYLILISFNVHVSKCFQVMMLPKIIDHKKGTIKINNTRKELHTNFSSII